MARKGPVGIKRQLITVVSDFETSMRRAHQRISDLTQYEHSGSVDEEELAAIRLSGEEMEKQSQDPDGNLACVTRDFLRPSGKTKSSKPSKKAMKNIMEELKKDLVSAENLHKDLDEIEDKFRKYNLPKRIADRLGRSCEPLEGYLDKVRDYMRVTWKEPAEKSREKGHKCLLDWIVELGKSGDGKSRVTSGEMRDLLVEMGFRISRFLVDYFLLISDSANKEEMDESLDEVETVIRCLSIEEDSAVINGFISLIEFSRLMIGKAKSVDSDNPVKIKSDPVIEKENEVFHLIVMEILRLEVSFRSPDIPFMLLNEMFYSIRKHLSENVFEKKLNRIGAKVRALKTGLVSGEKDMKTEFFEQALRLGVMDVWKELDLDAKAKD